MKPAPFVTPDFAEMRDIVAVMNTMRQASAKRVPDPVEWMTLTQAAAIMLAGWIYQSAVTAGIEPDGPDREAACLEVLRVQFKFGRQMAISDAPGILDRAGLRQ